MWSVFPVAFLQASVSCLLLGLAVWALLQLAARAWPGIALQRSVWLLAQAAVAATFVLVMLPQSASLSVLPPLPVSLSAPAAGGAPAAALSVLARTGKVDDVGDSVWLAAMPAETPSASDAAAAIRKQGWLRTGALAWLACYAAGLLLTVWRRLRAQRALRSLLALSHRLEAAELQAHHGFGQQSAAPGLTVMETAAAVSPMLLGLARPVLLLPLHLRQFDVQQQELIVAHELTHWRRRDQLWLHASLLLQALLWFNPVLRLLGKQLTWAQELSCDRQVLAGRPPQQRRSYAAALLAQLKAQQQYRPQGPGQAYESMAFGGAALESVAARVKQIRQSDLHPFGLPGKAALTAALLALLAASVLLQPAFAWRSAPPAGVAAPAPAAPAVLPQWHLPVGEPRVSSFFGVSRKSGKAHGGIDFAARTGTPVMATAAGTVIDSTDLYEGGVKYGSVIVIQHEGGLRTLYAHLDRRDVQAGDVVAAGQQIATSGASGRVTGPHLHLEVWQGGRQIDPQRLLAGLDAGAYKSALRSRQAPHTH